MLVSHYLLGRQPPASWTALILIDKIVIANPAISTNDLSNTNESDISQDLLYIIINKIALNQLDRKSKDYCNSGHTMEDKFTNYLMNTLLTNNFLFGEIEEIC